MLIQNPINLVDQPTVFAIGSPHFVTEDLDLSKGPVDGSAAAAVVAVGVDLDDQRHALHPLLRGEVCAQTVHRNKDLAKNK